MSDRDTVRVNLGRGLDAPSLSELRGLEVEGQGSVDLSGVTNYEITYDRRLPGPDATMRGSAFFQRSSDVRGAAPSRLVVSETMGMTSLQNPNVGDSSLRGLEVDLEGQVGGALGWGANYTHLSIEDDFTTNADRITEPFTFERAAPRHKANVRLWYRNRAWELGVYASYVSGTEMLQPLPRRPRRFVAQRIPAYALMRPRLVYSPSRHFSLELTVDDIPEHRETIYGEVETRALVSAVVRF